MCNQPFQFAHIVIWLVLCAHLRVIWLVCRAHLRETSVEPDRSQTTSGRLLLWPAWFGWLIWPNLVLFKKNGAPARTLGQNCKTSVCEPSLRPSLFMDVISGYCPPKKFVGVAPATFILPNAQNGRMD